MVGRAGRPLPMTKSNEPTVTGAHADVSSKLETVPGVAPAVTMETITKAEVCPGWCVMDHYASPE